MPCFHKLLENAARDLENTKADVSSPDAQTIRFLDHDREYVLMRKESYMAISHIVQSIVDSEIPVEEILFAYLDRLPIHGSTKMAGRTEILWIIQKYKNFLAKKGVQKI